MAVLTTTRARPVAAALLALLVAPGCVTGHLFDAARRRERPAGIEAAALDGDRLLLRYTTLVTDDLGLPRSRGERQVAIPLAALRRGEVELARLAGFTGRPLPVVEAPPGAGPALVVEADAGGRPARLVLHEAGTCAASPLPATALARTWTAPWAWPLVPLGLAVDAVIVPVLIALAPAVLVVGD